jgi:TatA/E family protein of Tat protein translocase
MFGPLGVPELIFIFVLALLIFGPRRLPEIGRTVGKAVGEFRRATTDLKRSINTEIALEEEKGKDGREKPKRDARREIEARVSEQGLLEAAPAGTVAQEPAQEPAADATAQAAGGEPAEVSAAETPSGDPEAAAGDEAAANAETGDDAAGDDEKVAAAGD